MNRFVFSEFRPAEHQSAAVVYISENLATFDELSNEIKMQLGLPDYYGNNWNALHDVLRDLSWVPQHDVIFVNKNRVFEVDWQWKTYLGVMDSCVESWQDPNEEHGFCVYFPEALRAEIESMKFD